MESCLLSVSLYCSVGLVCDPLVHTLVFRARLGPCMRVLASLFVLAEIGRERRKASQASQNQITTGLLIVTLTTYFSQHVRGITYVGSLAWIVLAHETK